MGCRGYLHSKTLPAVQWRPARGELEPDTSDRRRITLRLPAGENTGSNRYEPRRAGVQNPTPCHGCCVRIWVIACRGFGGVKNLDSAGLELRRFRNFANLFRPVLLKRDGHRYTPSPRTGMTPRDSRTQNPRGRNQRSQHLARQLGSATQPPGL